MKKPLIALIMILIASFTFAACDSGADYPANEALGSTILEETAELDGQTEIAETDDNLTGEYLSEFRAFDFNLPEDATLFPLNHDLFMHVRVQGMLPEFNPGSLRDGEDTLGFIQAGFLAMSFFVPAAERGEADVSEMILSLFAELGEEAHVPLRPQHKSIEISAAGTSAFATVPFTNATRDSLFSMAYLAQEEGDGGLFATFIMIIFNQLEEECIAILNRYSNQIGYDVLSAAAREMEGALDFLEFQVNAPAFSLPTL